MTVRIRVGERRALQVVGREPVAPQNPVAGPGERVGLPADLYFVERIAADRLRRQRHIGQQGGEVGGGIAAGRIVLDDEAVLEDEVAINRQLFGEGFAVGGLAFLAERGVVLFGPDDGGGRGRRRVRRGRTFGPRYRGNGSGCSR